MSVFVTGIGTLNAIGNSAQESLRALKAGKHGMLWSEEDQMMLGGVKLSNEEMCEKLNITDKKISRTSLMGMMAAKEAWGENQDLPDICTGMVASTSVGELDLTEKDDSDSKVDSSTNEAGKTTEQIAENLNITGQITTISTACSASANAILLGARLIQSGRLDRVLVGGVDPFCNHNKKGFTALGIGDKNPCSPFDRDRQGLNLGEGAAYLVLENELSLQKSKNEVLGKVSGWANTADAYHQTATSPEARGAVLAMNKALSRAGLAPSDIDYINAHGTGTDNNDESEARAIEKVFGSVPPDFSSTKSFTGHALAAAGSIEAVFSFLAIQNEFVPMNLGFKNKMDDFDFEPATALKNKRIQHVLSNSFGFGGNCTSLIFSKV